MKIFLNARSVFPGMTGIGHHVKNLVDGLAEVDHKNAYTLLVSPGFNSVMDSLPPNFAKVEVNTPNPYWEQTQLPSLLAEFEAGLYHSPALELPAVKVVPMVVTIHDLIPKIFPEDTPMPFLAYFNRCVNTSINNADRIITVSENSKRDIVNLCGVPEENVRVIYQGISPRYFQEVTAGESKHILDEIGIDSPYILYVGALDSRKNITRMLEAFSIFIKRTKSHIKLVLCGKVEPTCPNIEAEAKKLAIADAVVDLGYVEEEVLPTLYKNAALFLFPSLYEGFGLPIIEAFASGTPVITSRVSSTGEISVDAALLVNPYDSGEIARAIETIVTDEHKRAELIEFGKKKARMFTLAQAASTTIEVYKEVLVATSGLHVNQPKGICK